MSTIVGHYAWTWKPTGVRLHDANFSVAFNGFLDVDNILDESNRIYDTLTGEKYVAFGGGNSYGHLSSAKLQAIDTAISSGRFNRYDGFVYDIEIGDNALASALLSSFSTAKRHGFVVIVTVSHSAPYGINDAANIMDAILACDDVDYISPQLYTSGSEATNDYNITQGYGWEKYTAAKPFVIPSIVHRSYYEDARVFFSRKGIRVHGFIQWQQAS